MGLLVLRAWSPLVWGICDCLGFRPVSMLLGRLGLLVRWRGSSGVAIMVWLLGSEESEAREKLGFIVAVALAVAAMLEAVFLAG